MFGKIELLKENEVGYGLLVEQDAGFVNYEINKEIIKEDYSLNFNDGRLFINCILQKADTENRNGRIYPKAILEREIQKYQQSINDNNALGEANHPNTITVDITNVPHRVVKTWWDGNTVYGKLEILISKGYIEMGICSTSGDKIAELLRQKVKLGISSRGVGSLKTIKGKNYVQDDFELVCFDLVCSPSTPGAYLFFEKENTINENHSIKNNNKIITKINKFLND